MTPEHAIIRFQGAYRWLSNFWLTPVTYLGYTYPSSEHAFQAAKATCYEDTIRIAHCHTPGQAKRMGNQIRIRNDWEMVKVAVMRTILEAKFNENAELRNKLIQTGEAALIEGNTWGDVFWGVCNGEGQNMLGQLLMQIRTELQR